MACYKKLVSIILAIIVVFLSNCSSAQQLNTSFYKNTCPRVFDIVRNSVNTSTLKDRRMAASFLRLHFHDCFVNGCDASVLLDDTSNLKGEKNAFPNQNSLRGFDIIKNIKIKLEKACPRVVSCADILAIIARDAVKILGGPTWDVILGRRDSRNVSEMEANKGIPSATSSINNLTTRFSSLGLNTKDLVALSGAHTIGQARCTNFRARIYNETGSTINSTFAQERRRSCPKNTGNGDNNLAPLDRVTPIIFDNEYFKNLVEKKGLLHSDQQLFSGGNSESNNIVQDFADKQDSFFRAFALAMIKMGNISLLTGSEGEIRTNCSKIN